MVPRIELRLFVETKFFYFFRRDFMLVRKAIGKEDALKIIQNNRKDCGECKDKENR